MKSIIRICLCIFLLFISTNICLANNSNIAKGKVFIDSNKNLKHDKGEEGVPGVMISNREDIILTDKNGDYQISAGDESIIFITKPTGFQVPMDENNMPQFYYIHQPKGSPKGLKFQGIDPTGKLPDSINFPLYKTEVKNSFKAIFVGDPQPDKDSEVSYYRDDIINEMMNKDAEFYLALGDIVGDNLSLYKRLNRIVGQIGIPAYNVMGNHDMNYQVPDRQYEAETFKSIFGPDYYSFNYGKVHFVVLNDIEYKGWNNAENKHGGYIGSIGDKQLEWLKNDISLVPENYLIVINKHIPLSGGYEKENRKALFEILKNRKHLLATAGHTHSVELLNFNKEYDWKGEATFPNMILGAGCGSWWTGPVDARGIPVSTCMDGAPNGFFIFSFDGNQFDYHFYPANHSSDFQMRICSPSGIMNFKKLENQQIIVNIFAGHQEMAVHCQLDHGAPIKMNREIMRDPFLEKYFEKHSEQFKGWVSPANSTHIWVAPLPTDIQKGVHKIKILAEDQKGHSYTGYQIFEVR